MTFKKIIIILAAVLPVIVSCGKPEQEKEPARFSLGTTSINAPAEGGSFEVTFTCNEAWWATTKDNWISLSKKQGSGSDGSQSITVTVAKNNDPARTGAVTFQCGAVETGVNVSQAAGISDDGIKSLTISEFNAQKDDDKVWFRLNGVEVVSISSYAYGDLYVKDKTGFLYVYGLAPQKGGATSDFEKIGIKAGDKITIVAHRKTYSGVIETDGAYLEKKESGSYPGKSSKTASQKWLELPATASADENVVFLTHPSENGGRNFSVYFNKTNRIAIWSCYAYVCGQGGSGRSNAYAFDPLVDHTAQAALTKSYTEASRKIGGYEYIRGHLLPSNDRSGGDNYDAYLATNIIPQSSALNEGLWASLEKKIHNTWSAKCDTMYIVTGTDTKTSIGKVKDIDGKDIVVPGGIYKAILAHTTKGEYKALGVYLENKANPASEYSKTYSMSIDELEKKVGEDFFVNLPADVQTAVEAAKPSDDSWWWN